MSPVVKRIGIAALAAAGLIAAASGGLGLILRYQPPPLMTPARWFAARVLNPPVLWYTQRFDPTSQPLVYHWGRKSGNEYVTPLCMVSTDEGFIVPAAFGPGVDWMANLRATPESRVVYEGVTYDTVAHVIDLDQAVEYAGGKPGCPCWTQFKVENLVILRPVNRAA
jgi:deazaflavin-dependent oxidoreductase (nitroreductase family)